MDVDPDKVAHFVRPEDFDAWLEVNHARANEIWVQLYKKQSGQASINWEEAVVAALAWGWIDGIKKSNDEMSWFQRFTPRKAKSGWSKKNRSHAEKLIAEGKMQAAGLVHVKAAQADGRWDTAYAGSAEMELPADFLEAIAQNPPAKETFDGLNKANLFAIYHRLHSAKKPETRQNRMTKIIETLARGERFH